MGGACQARRRKRRVDKAPERNCQRLPGTSRQRIRFPAMKAILRFWPLLALLLAVVLAYATGFADYASFESLRENRALMTTAVDRHPLLSLIVFVIVYTALTTVAVPGAVFLILAAGFLFGPWVGGMAVAVGATAGAVIKYYVVRTAFGDRLREKAHREGGALWRIRERLDNNAFFYLLTLRLIPAVPFVLVSIAAGLAAVPVRTYTLASFIGVVPSSILYAAVGGGLGDMLAEGRPPKLDLLLEPRVLIPLLVLAGLSLLPALFRLTGGRGTSGRKGSLL